MLVIAKDALKISVLAHALSEGNFATVGKGVLKGVNRE